MAQCTTFTVYWFPMSTHTHFHNNFGLLLTQHISTMGVTIFVLFHQLLVVYGQNYWGGCFFEFDQPLHHVAETQVSPSIKHSLCLFFGMKCTYSSIIRHWYQLRGARLKLRPHRMILRGKCDLTQFGRENWCIVCFDGPLLIIPASTQFK